MKHADLFDHFQRTLDPDRRRFLTGVGAAGLLGAAPVLIPSPAQAASQASPVRTQARIVIAGGGAAGLTAASRLAAGLSGATIVMIDAREQHYYQPGFTLVASGVKPQGYVVSKTADYVPQGIEWIQDSVAEIDPESKRVVTSGGRSERYDFLIVATGMELNYAAIDGMDPGRIGQNGLASIYNGPQGAADSWKALHAFTQRGGVGVFGRPASEMKCAGAPLKYTFLADDHLRRSSQRSNTEMVYMAPGKVLFSVPIVAEKLRMLFQERGIHINRDHVLKSIDLDRRIATYQHPGGTIEQGYDFIHVIPPMRAPAVVRNSPLPWTEGPYQADGWIEVDRHTLRHARYPEVFAIGDVAGVPKGKTAASVKWQTPVAVSHLIGDISGKASSERYNGYTSCPMITRLGQAMLIEFDYQDNLITSFPGMIAPLEELWISWVIKTVALKPTYLSMLRGRA